MKKKDKKQYCPLLRKKCKKDKCVCYNSFHRYCEFTSAIVSITATGTLLDPVGDGVNVNVSIMNEEL